MISQMFRTITITALISLSGCAATVTKSGPSQPLLTTSAIASKFVIMQVQAAPGMPLAGSWEQLLVDWRDGVAIAAGHSGKRVFWQEGQRSDYTDPAVMIIVKIRNYQYMTPESRIGMGIFAGNAYVNAEVDFYELPSKKLLGTKIYGTSTSAAEGILSATTRKQVIAMSSEVIGELR
jgi:hypothetical protein